MKKYIKEIIALFIQLIIFYILPLFSDSYNVIGMVLLLILLTFILSIIYGSIAKSVWKYKYPVIISILFIPSVFIYYNESALIHSVWYLIISYVGIFIGSLIGIIIKKNDV